MNEARKDFPVPQHQHAMPSSPNVALPRFCHPGSTRLCRRPAESLREHSTPDVHGGGSLVLPECAGAGVRR